MSAGELTLFAIPKPFVGHIGVIQRNAIASWTHIGESVRVVLYGDEEGAAQAARSAGVTHVPAIPLNEFGTPLLNAVFDDVRNRFPLGHSCYVNADIILDSDLLDAASRLGQDPFLAVGRRWDLDVTEVINFDDPSARGELVELLERTGRHHPPLGSDFFLYPAAVDWGFEPFAVGRPGWDNWLIYRARSLGVPVVDATDRVRVVHQNHAYAHVQGARETNNWEGVEGDRNRELAGGYGHLYDLWDVTHRLTGEGVVPVRGPRYQWRRAYRLRQRMLTRHRLQKLLGFGR